MDSGKLISVESVTAGGRTVLVKLFQNARGGVSGEFPVGPNDRGVLDGDTAEELLKLIADVLELAWSAHRGHLA